MESEAFAPGKGLAVPGRGVALRRGEELFFGSSTEEIGLCGIILGQPAALVEDEAVKGAEGENLSVPVVEGHAVGLGEFGGWKAFHASAMKGSVSWWSGVDQW